jgi:predicted ester cyclase
MGRPERDLVARFYDEVLNQRKLDVLPDLLDPDFVEHGTPPVIGLEGFRSFIRGLTEGLPDLRLEVEDWIVERDRVVARCSVTGTHSGELLGFAPTGRPISWTAIHIWRVANGRLVERWSEADVLGLVEQVQGSRR